MSTPPPPTRSTSSLSLAQPPSPPLTAHPTQTLQGPFPTLPNSQHSMDPHGLNRFLLSPEDPVWRYMLPEPVVRGGGEGRKSGEGEGEEGRREEGVKGEGQGEGRKFKSSPLANPPISGATDGAVPTRPPKSGKRNSMISTLKLRRSTKDLGLHKLSTPIEELPTLRPPSSVTPATSAATTPTVSPRLGTTALLSLTAANRSGSLLSMDSTSSGSSEVDSEVRTPGVGGSVVSLLVPEVVERERGMEVEVVPPAAAEVKEKKRGWKNWLSPSLTTKNKKPATVKSIHSAPTVVKTLSADPLAGDTPSSLPLDRPATQQLHVPSRTPSPLPANIRALRTLSLRKLGALRQGSPHPVLVDQNLPLHLGGGGAQGRGMRFPRSTNPVRRVGSGLGPAEGGLVVDVLVRGLLGRVDEGRFGDLMEIRMINLSTSASSNGKTTYPGAGGRHPTIILEGMTEPSIYTFLTRPPFEDRLVVFLPGGVVHPVESAGGRAMYDLEFSVGLEAMGEEEEMKRRDRRRGYGRSEGSEGGRSYAAWGGAARKEQGQGQEGRPVHLRARTDEGKVGERREAMKPESRTKSAPDLVVLQEDAREFKSMGSTATLKPEEKATPVPATATTTATAMKARKWVESESEESEEEEETSDVEPLSTLPLPPARPTSMSSRPPAIRPRPITVRPYSLQPPSLTTPPSPASPLSASASLSAIKASRRDTKSEEAFKDEIRRARERREDSRKGLVEREAAKEVTGGSRRDSQRPGIRPSGSRSTLNSSRSGLPSSPSGSTTLSLPSSRRSQSHDYRSQPQNHTRPGASPLTRQSMSAFDLAQAAQVQGYGHPSPYYSPQGMVMPPMGMPMQGGMYVPVNPYAMGMQFIPTPAHGYFAPQMPVQYGYNPVQGGMGPATGTGGGGGGGGGGGKRSSGYGRNGYPVQ